MACATPTSCLLASENQTTPGLLLKIEEQPDEIVTNDEIHNWIDYNPTLKYNKKHHSSIENINICPEKDKLVCSLTVRTIDRIHIQKTSKPVVSEERVISFLEDLARKINIDPVNAAFTVSNDRVSAFSIEKDGFNLDIEKSKQALLSKLATDYTKDSSVQLTINTVSPKIKSADVNKLGIETLIGEGRSNFYGSTSSRIHNINVATSRFDGYLIKPGEEFSFVSILGEVDGEHGYRQELVIKNNKTEPEFGGGVCQVSTTMFRAAIYSGLEITARRNHAYPVSYYNPQGMDSTVYIPRPDLKFINNTKGHILIKSELNIPKRELVFKFYGTDESRTIEIDGPHILSREADGSMKTTFTQTVLDKDGDEILSDVFKSNYDSPNNYPHPDQTKLTEKPDDWSKRQWKEYRRAHGI
ncbi:VanW family protein [Patescibacteria group bacterium]